jgi:uncharacterized protein DUF932
MFYRTRAARFGEHQSFSPQNPMTDEDLQRVAPAIFAEDKHDSRSDRYSYIPTALVLAGMRNAGFVPVRAIQGGSRIAGKAEFTKHMIRFQHADFAGRKDLAGTSPEVVLLNSHDGTTCYRLMAGVFRSICTNSMIVMEDGAADMRIPHKDNIIDNVIEGSYEVIAESRRTLDKAETWQGITLSSDEQMVMADAARVLRFGDAEGNVETPIKADQLLRARRVADQGNNLWLTHNRLQENMIKGGLRAWGRDANNRSRRTTTREVRNIDGDVKLNRALWVLSHRMAELKVAA